MDYKQENGKMNNLRRTLLKGAVATGSLAMAAAAGLLRPTGVYAAEWSKSAFEAKTMADALKGISGENAPASPDIVIKAPDVAENGATVPIEVRSNIPDTHSIALLVEKNPLPLSTLIEFTDGAIPYVKLRLKFSETSQVKAVVRAGGKSYSASAVVKVAVGGCS